MTADTLERLGRDYAPALLSYLARQDEAGLQAAYGLGRGAMSSGVSMLDLVGVHHAVYLDVIRTVPDVEEMRSVVPAAAAFLVEALAPFEMAHRGLLPTAARRHGANRP